jgi:DNA-binding beta-propeller fold protein YncE
MDMLFDSAGTPWFIDWNNHIVRRVLEDDTVETIVGWVDPVFPGDGESTGAEKSAEGAVGTTVQLNHPTDLVEGVDGSILLMAWHNHKLRSIDPATGRVRILGGAGAGFAGDGGPLSKALFRQPRSLEIDPEGHLYILDQQNFRIRRAAADGMVTTIAGSGMQGSAGDGGLAVEATLSFEAGSNPEPSGGLAFHEGKLYFADTLAHRIRVLDLETGRIGPFAGTGTPGYSGDGGPAEQAEFRNPRDLEIGPDGALYVADTDNSVIRAIDVATGEVRTVAGTGELGMTDEGPMPATEVALKRPFGITFDAAGNLYISDSINSRIVRVAR